MLRRELGLPVALLNEKVVSGTSLVGLPYLSQDVSQDVGLPAQRPGHAESLQPSLVNTPEPKNNFENANESGSRVDGASMSLAAP